MRLSTARSASRSSHRSYFVFKVTRPASQSSHHSYFVFKVARPASINLDTSLLDLARSALSLGYNSNYHTCFAHVHLCTRPARGGANSQVTCEGRASPHGSKCASVRLLVSACTVTLGSNTRACYLTCDLYCTYDLHCIVSSLP